MIQSEVIDKITRECCLELGSFDYFTVVHKHIQRALCVGIEHYTVDMEEIVALYRDGVEAGRFKSVKDAADKLGVTHQNITAVLNGRQHTAGGVMFIRTKDYELIEREKERLDPVQPCT
jgi:hypothetical protein